MRAHTCAHTHCLSRTHAGNRKAGGTRVLYDISFSERGVVGAVGRAPRTVSPFDYQPPDLVKAPHALPMYKDQSINRKRRWGAGWMAASAALHVWPQFSCCM